MESCKRACETLVETSKKQKIDHCSFSECETEWAPSVLSVSDDHFSDQMDAWSEISEDLDENENLAPGNTGGTKNRPESQQETAEPSFAPEIGKQLKASKRTRIVKDREDAWEHFESAKKATHPVDADSHLPRTLKAVIDRNAQLSSEEVQFERENLEKLLF